MSRLFKKISNYKEPQYSKLEGTSWWAPTSQTNVYDICVFEPNGIVRLYRDVEIINGREVRPRQEDRPSTWRQEGNRVYITHPNGKQRDWEIINGPIKFFLDEPFTLMKR